MHLQMDFSGFVAQYFVNPICVQGEFAPYNVYNTAFYAALALFGAWLIFRVVKREKIRVNEAFLWSAVPFIFFGSALRVLEDAHLLPRCASAFGMQNIPLPFTSPGIYLLVAATLGACFLLAQFLKASHSVPRSKTMQITGWLLFSAAFAALVFAVGAKFNLVFAGAMILLAVLAFAAFSFALKALKQKEADSFEKLAFFSQCFDGAATFVGTTFAGYGEQHVVGNAVIDLFGGSYAFFLLKIIFALAVVMVARREFSKAEEQERNFVLLLVMVMGLAPGLRDMLRIAAGV
ncbi:MAG: DUF63 family protein [Candidatus Micrarchaeia archaeon]|jgi:uncharacterized membrane protein